MTPRSSAHVRLAALTLLAAALVTGIVGMHSLTRHGSDHEVRAAHHATPSATMADRGPTAGDDHGDHGPAAGLMLCGAVLAVAGVVLARHRLLLRCWAGLARALRPPQPLVRQVRTPPATGPPPMWRFSVVRC